jgi:sigma-B regulation protein RsbU (phosphoserine phosphatase)
MSVADSNTSRLKIYSEEIPQPWQECLNIASLPEVLRAFKRLTGRSLQYIPPGEANVPADLTWSAPVSPGAGVTPGHLRLEPVTSSAGYASPIDPKQTDEMASALAGMLSELLRTRYALWQREAELAAGVPLICRSDEPRHLADRLQSALKGGAEAIGGHAAGLYLLDEATTQLKLRSSWNLPHERFTDAARPLQGALADLEAMLGHAVVLEDTLLVDHWNAPEDFPAAVCVPVSTPTTILGTLWVFSNIKRDFTDSQTNILEIVAGRIAAELEREILIAEGVDGARLKGQLAAAERLQKNQLPMVPPLLDGWDMAGWAEQAEEIGGDFYDWFCLPNGLVVIAAGSVAESGVPAALIANNARTALRSHARYHRDADRLLRQVNLTLWTGSAGDQSASMFCGILETATGRMSYAYGGNASFVLLSTEESEVLSQRSPRIGESPETDFESHAVELQPGNAILVLTGGFHKTMAPMIRPTFQEALSTTLAGQLTIPAKDLAACARDRLVVRRDDAAGVGRTVLVVKRANP